MRLRVTVIFACFWLLAAAPAASWAQSDLVASAAERIRAASLRQSVETLTQDAWTGRNAGTPGNDRAALWIARQFSDMGLATPPGEDEYFQPFEFPVRGQVEGGEENAVTRNIWGYWEGKDDALKREVVIVGAHMDHVGASDQPDSARLGAAFGDDDIWNGADDNASGTAAVIEVARAFAESGLRTRRSLVFILWSAEEHGLLGSEHYVVAPAFPLSDTALYINLDMIGRNPDRPVSIEGADGVRGDYLKKVIARVGDQTGLSYQLDTGALTQMFGIAGSDYAPFAKKKVPFLAFFTGFHADYHGAADHPEKIAYDNMEKIARSVFLTMLVVAQYERRPEVKPASFLDALRGGLSMLRERQQGGGMGPAPEAGDQGLAPLAIGARLRVAEDGKRAGALEIVALTDPEGPAKKAALQVGDVITAVGGEKLDDSHPLQHFAERLSVLGLASKTGEVELAVERDGKAGTVTVIPR